MSIRDFKNKIGKLAGKDLLNDVDKKLQKGTAYRFLSGYVKEIITNPYDYLNRPYRVNDQTVYNEVTIKDVLSGRVTTLPGGENVKSPIKNFEHVPNMPMNSSIVQIIDDGRGGDGEKPVVCYPFFPSHFSLPLKVGEYVWMIEENIKGVINYYWMCRKTGIIQVEDLNFTNLERTSINTTMYDKHEESGGVFVPSSETKEKMISLAKSEVSNIAEESYSNLLKNSFNHVTEFVGEAVPRMKKRSSDLLLQGSNNAGIHLTVEKFSDLNLNDTGASLNDGYVNSPAIDIFIKRDPPGLDTIKTKNFSDADENIEHEEINKIRDLEEDATNTSIELHDIFPQSAAARIYMSNNSNFDSDFGLTIDSAVLSSNSGTCIVSYTENNRLVGTNNTRILNTSGESYIDMASTGNVVMKASKSNGQEFISLDPNNNTTRINAKDKILLTHGSDNNTPASINITNPGEPYVLVSQLEDILKHIYMTLNIYNAAFFALAPMRHPSMVAPAVEVLKGLFIEPLKIPTPGPTKYSVPNANLQPVITAPSSGLQALLIGKILRSDHIIADKESP